jgi:hypothetical protein
LLTWRAGDKITIMHGKGTNMIQGPVYEMVQSVKQLVVEVLEEASKTLEQAKITDRTSLMEVGSIFGALADSIVGLGNALGSLAGGLVRLGESGASADQINTHWQRLRRAGN